MLAISRASFRAITRSPSAVVFTIAFPLIFIIVFGFIGSGAFTIKVGISAGSDTDNPVYKVLEENSSVRMVRHDTAGMMENLRRGRVDAVVDIRSTGSKPAYRVELKTSDASPAKGEVISLIIENTVNRMNIDEAHLRGAAAALQRVQVTGRKYRTIDFILPGQLGFSLLSAGVFGTAFVFFNLRQTLVLKRFFATPIRRPFIILGEAGSRMVFSLLGALVIITIGYYAFGFTLVNGLYTVLTMMLLSAIGLALFMGFGFIVSGVARNDSAIPPLANLITLPQFLLSGTFFSIDVYPEWLQPLCRALPLTYLNDALRQVAFEGAGMGDITNQLLVLCAWGVVLYAVAFKTFRWE